MITKKKKIKKLNKYGNKIKTKTKKLKVSLGLIKGQNRKSIRKLRYWYKRNMDPVPRLIGRADLRILKGQYNQSKFDLRYKRFWARKNSKKRTKITAFPVELGTQLSIFDNLISDFGE